MQISAFYAVYITKICKLSAKNNAFLLKIQKNYKISRFKNAYFFNACQMTDIQHVIAGK